MKADLAVPYIVSHAAAIVFALIAWRRPSIARWIAGLGFALAGAFNLWTVSSNPQVYVDGFGPYAFSPYREFIYGAFAQHTRACVTAIACGQMASGLLILSPLPWRRLGYAGAIVFLVAITPLGFGSGAPSNLIFAAGVARLLWQSRTKERTPVKPDPSGNAA